jgi:predicted MPP superfamily phosphohydrolase
MNYPNPLATKYTFILLLFALVSYSQKKSEETAPLKEWQVEDHSLSFFVIGDWGRNGEHHQKEVAEGMKKAAEKVEPEFVISTGDNFYCCGVASAQDPQWKTSFEDIYQGSALQIDWYPVLGNHDYHGNPQAEIDYSKVSRRWNMPARYYTFVKNEGGKTIRFIFLDTNPFVKKYLKDNLEYADVAQQDTSKQLQWLDSLLLRNEDLKIVVGHHPVYSSSKRHGNTPELIASLEPRFKKHNVQLYLAGHDHDLQLQQPDGKTLYVVSGAGSELRPATSAPYTKYAGSVSGFLVVSIKERGFTLRFVDKNNALVYSYKGSF